MLRIRFHLYRIRVTQKDDIRNLSTACRNPGILNSKISAKVVFADNFNHIRKQGCGSGSGMFSSDPVLSFRIRIRPIYKQIFKNTKKLFYQRQFLKILIKFFFRHNFVVFAGGDAITNMMTRHPFTLVGSGSAMKKLKIRIRNDIFNPVNK